MFFIRCFIRGYQVVLSPVISFLAGPGAGCRFEPTCSHYFLQACETHGAVRGSWFGIKRLARCHPWGGSGFDPVPLKTDSKKCSCVEPGCITHL
ncbi:MAG: membrane protein insertion efficiency factor YidD [Verrucomicrobiota bacterium]